MARSKFSFSFFVIILFLVILATLLLGYRFFLN